MPDPHPTITLLVQLGQLFAYVCGGVAAVTAIIGISAWRRQLLGTRRIDVASRALRTFYNAKNDLAWVRNPGSFTYEHDEITRLPEETDRQFQARAPLQLVKNRFRNARSFAELDSLRYELLVTFGRPGEAPFVSMRSAVSDLLASADMCIQVQAHVTHQEEAGVAVEPRLYDEIALYHQRIYGLPPSESEKDSVTRSIDQAIAGIEQVCIPVINPPTLLKRLLG